MVAVILWGHPASSLPPCRLHLVHGTGSPVPQKKPEAFHWAQGLYWSGPSSPTTLLLAYSNPSAVTSAPFLGRARYPSAREAFTGFPSAWNAPPASTHLTDSFSLLQVFAQVKPHNFIHNFNHPNCNVTTIPLLQLLLLSRFSHVRLCAIPLSCSIFSHRLFTFNIICELIVYCLSSLSGGKPNKFRVLWFIFLNFLKGLEHFLAYIMSSENISVMNVWKKLLVVVFDNYFPSCTIPADLAAFVVEIMSYLLIVKLPGMQYCSAGFPPVNNWSLRLRAVRKITGKIQKHLT